MNVIEMLENELKEIDRALKILNKRKNTQLEQCGTVWTRPVRGGYQYYIKLPGDDTEIYVPKSKVNSLKTLAQNEYVIRTEKDLVIRKRNIEKFLKHYDEFGVNSVYERLSEGKKALVKPLKKTDEMIVEEWYKTHPGSQNTYPQEMYYTTERGESVRSKSELIIANMLNKYDIPYQYEAKLVLSGGKVIYPDFTLLNVSKRKTVYWEHLGLVSEIDYAEKNYLKLINYEKNDIILGDNLIVTMELGGVALDTELVKRKIKMFLL